MTNHTQTIFNRQNNNDLPDYYITNYPKSVVHEFKVSTVIGLSSSDYVYTDLTTYVSWNDNSVSLVQIAYAGEKIYRRISGVRSNTWGTWQRLATEGDITNYLDETFDSSQIAGFSKDNITKILKYNDFSVKLGIDVNCSVPYSTNGFYSNIFNSTLPANLRPKQDTYVSCMYLKNNVFFCGTIVIGANGIISLFTSETDTHNIVRLAFNVSYLK